MPSFLAVYPSDILRPPTSVTRSLTLIENTDRHTAKETHWLAIRHQPRYYYGYFFDSYGLPPLDPIILTFLFRACSVCEYNTTQLQSLSCSAYGTYCCIFAFYMYRGYSPKKLWVSSLPPPPTGISTATSQQNSDCYAQHLAGVRAALLLFL